MKNNTAIDTKNEEISVKSMETPTSEQVAEASVSTETERKFYTALVQVFRTTLILLWLTLFAWLFYNIAASGVNVYTSFISAGDMAKAVATQLMYVLIFIVSRIIYHYGFSSWLQSKLLNMKFRDILS